MSKILSTPNSRTIPMTGTPAARRIDDSITMPAPGADGAPMDAISAVIAIKMMVVVPSSILKSWARKNTATI